MSIDKKIKEITTHLINALVTDGAHHKQWDIEQALIVLRGIDWIEQNRWCTEDGEVVSPTDDQNEDLYERWEKGIPA